MMLGLFASLVLAVVLVVYLVLYLVGVSKAPSSPSSPLLPVDEILHEREVVTTYNRYTGLR